MSSAKACRPLSAVVAIGRNGAFGRDGRLPWEMPTDIARFRALTMGKPMIMGRRTFESIGRALPGRDSVVVSRRPIVDLPANGYSATTPEEALAVADARATATGAPDIALIGGALLLEAMMTHVDRFYLTIVDLWPTADTFFAFPDPYIWREASRQVPPRRATDEAGCVFLVFERA